MQERNTIKIIWYLFSSLFVMWAVEGAAGFTLMALGVKNAAWISMISSAVLIPIVYRMYRKDRVRYGEEGELWWKYEADAGVKEYVVLFVFGISVCILLNNLLNLVDIQSVDKAYVKMAEGLYKAPQIVLFIGAGIFAPVAEELVYRGMLYRRMRERLPVWQASLFSSVLFGIGHGYLSQCLYALVQGMFLSLVYEKYRTVKAPMMLHVVINITVLVLNWTQGFEWMLENFMRAALITSFMAALAFVMFDKIRNIKLRIK